MVFPIEIEPASPDGIVSDKNLCLTLICLAGISLCFVIGLTIRIMQ